MADTRKSRLFFSLVERFLLALFYFIYFLARFAPPSLFYRIFYFIGYVLFYTRPEMRRHLLNNLKSALPEVTDQRQLKRIARKTCSAPFLPMLDIIIMKVHNQRVMDKLRIEGMEHLELADKKGKGVILFSPHLGAFSTVTAVMARLGKAYTPLALHPLDTAIPRYLMTTMFFAQTLGCDPENPVFWVQMDVIPKVQKHLRQGKRVGITFDIMGDAVYEFFGSPAALASGIAHFAFASGAPIIPVYLLRGKDPLERRLKIFEPIAYTLSGDHRVDVDTIMRQVIKSGEELIRTAPEQWMGWFGLVQWRKKAEELEQHHG